MSYKNGIRALYRLAGALGGAGLLLASSCSIRDVQAVTVGLDAAASYLDSQRAGDDISFGDWLADELDD